jgi:hypothetical protein
MGERKRVLVTGAGGFISSRTLAEQRFDRAIVTARFASVISTFVGRRVVLAEERVDAPVPLDPQSLERLTEAQLPRQSADSL